MAQVVAGLRDGMTMGLPWYVSTVSAMFPAMITVVVRFARVEGTRCKRSHVGE
jgi:hypothetical protein